MYPEQALGSPFLEEETGVFSIIGNFSVPLVDMSSDGWLVPNKIAAWY